jgi:uncharacterized FlgJ-related protein
MSLKTLFIALFLGSSTEDLQVRQHLDSLAAYPCIAFAIYQHETGHGKSNLARKHNNMFGIKGTKFISGRTKGGYSKYTSVLNSVLAYVEYESRMIEKYNLDNSKKYLTFVARRYARPQERTNWLKNIKSHIINCR